MEEQKRKAIKGLQIGMPSVKLQQRQKFPLLETAI